MTTHWKLSNGTRSPVLATVIVCAALAIVAILLGLAFGHPRAGLALGAGLLVGSSNGYLARRSILAGGLHAASGVRLALLTVAGIGFGVLIGLDVAWLTILGVGLSQLVLAAVAASALIKR